MCSSFPFGFEGGVWDLIVLIPDHCLFVYFPCYHNVYIYNICFMVK